MKKIERTIRPLLCICLGASLAISPAADCFAAEKTHTAQTSAEDGMDDDTSVEIIEINTVEEFLQFAENCSFDHWSLNHTVRLMTDLDLSGRKFDGISYFNGTFEGNGHRIFSFDLTPNGSAYGFFRYIGETGQVKDLNLEGSVRPEGSQNQIGGVVGVNYGTVEHCSFKGGVNGQDEVGAIAGVNKNTGTLTSCTSNATVSATNHTGGIAGKNEGLISWCLSESDVNVEELETTLDQIGRAHV